MLGDFERGGKGSLVKDRDIATVNEDMNDRGTLDLHQDKCRQESEDEEVERPTCRVCASGSARPGLLHTVILRNALGKNAVEPPGIPRSPSRV